MIAISLKAAVTLQLALAWNPKDLQQIEQAHKNMRVHFWEPSTAFRHLLAESKLAGGLPELRQGFSLLNALFSELQPGNHRVIRDNALIQQLQTFQLGLLKGEEFPGNYGKGLVHRSPAMMTSDEPRWIFRLDTFRMTGQR